MVENKECKFHAYVFVYYIWLKLCQKTVAKEQIPRIFKGALAAGSHYQPICIMDEVSMP